VLLFISCYLEFYVSGGGLGATCLHCITFCLLRSLCMGYLLFSWEDLFRSYMHIPATLVPPLPSLRRSGRVLGAYCVVLGVSPFILDAFCSSYLCSHWCSVHCYLPALEVIHWEAGGCLFFPATGLCRSLVHSHVHCW